jgi:hypothetical protein
MTNPTGGNAAYRTLERRAAAQYARKLRSQQRHRPGSAAVKPYPPGASQRLRRLWVLLDGELDRLPEEWRAPIVLCYLEGRTIDEAVTLLAWSKARVTTGLHLGRARLTRRLAERGVRVRPREFRKLLRRDARAGSVSPSLMTATMRAATQAARPGAAAFAAMSGWVAGLVRRSLRWLDRR